jgi:hypothetical protein
VAVWNFLQAAQRAFAAAIRFRGLQGQCLSPPGDHFSVKLNR